MRTVASCLIQVGLLAYCYTDPASRTVPGWLYLLLLAMNTGLLLVLAFNGFKQPQPVLAIMAGLLAFPGLLLLVAALVFGVHKFNNR
jgi:Flp pilus assembly protein protease CpaA